MTRAELVAALRQRGAPDWLYVLDGGLGTGECYGIEPHGGGWRLYYSERGGKSALASFPDEDAACRGLLARIAADPTWQKTGGGA
jgi:hypothetical protein